ncbi:regulator of G-protein signaling 12b isoform X2 [Callorhinchus milii]|uniref:regulator of G-protein signaling 12b isoform X2 n=1 Tax=Callorhinchus milii TaxID=7868 RepID=UPI001C3F55B0|nr:regulator of G-protein signaling 12b isoform X2 [Callorhinchus milii]
MQTMYRQADQVKRRLNPNAPIRMRNVDVARGRTGYGFTLSGQAPCVLSCILKGSPADYVGLRSGDRILSVNDINVSKASHDDVVKLIGKCTGVLQLVIADSSNHSDTGSSDEELYFNEGKGGWMNNKPKSKHFGLNRAEKVVADIQSGGIFNVLFENSKLPAKHSRNCLQQQRKTAETVSGFPTRHGNTGTNHNSLSEEEVMKVLNDNSMFASGLESQDDFALDSNILNVGMIVGYLGSIELPSTSSNLENDSLQAIRGCMRRLRAEQKIHSLVLMKIMHDCIKLCNDKNAVLAVYPAEKLAFTAVCPDDRRFFGLVTMQIADDNNFAKENEGGLRTSCHVFMVDPELCQHKIHQGIARRFDIDCTPDTDTNGCLEFPPSSQPVLQFVSVLYKDLGESFESMRARAFLDGDVYAPDGQQNNSTGSNSDSGIGCYSQEEKSRRVLVVDLGTNPNKHASNGARGSAQNKGPIQTASQWNGCRPDLESKFHAPRLSDLAQNDYSLHNGNRHMGSSTRLDVPGTSAWSAFPSAKKADITGNAPCANPKWLPLHIRKDWQYCSSSDQESYAESTDGLSSVNCGTLKQDLPPPMSKIQTEKYRVGSGFGQPFRAVPQKDELTRKLFGVEKMFGIQQNSKKSKDKKVAKLSGILVGFPQASQRSSVRRSYGRSKRFSITRSLDDLETAAVSDGELNGADLNNCNSDNSLNSNASLPSVQSCKKHTERRVASWAVSFERLLQDSVGIRFFSEFLKKEFSEENILFWQSCEYFGQIAQNDRKQLLYRAREIYNNFLSNKAITPVNIDSQAQLADEIINAPHPNMFKEQQLQIFNLMKFDSYTRFLKSPLYQECMLAEVEGRSLPDPCLVPSSPASKHSASSDLSTPKKFSTKSKSGRLLLTELDDEDGNKKKGAFFSWSRRSLGRPQKRKENSDSQGELSDSNGLSHYRRESLGSMSSSTCTESTSPGYHANNKQEKSDATRVLMPMTEKEKSAKHCIVNLPDGSSYTVAIQAGISIRELLTELSEQLHIQVAAIDLFLVGADKPLVLDQDCITLNTREVRLEKRTLFRLDLVPINRSVGLKAKPTKPVTEVLRPVVAKYGLKLNELVARINGEDEVLDLGIPISNLDGMRVVLDVAEHSAGKDKQKSGGVKPGPSTLGTRNHDEKEERNLGKPSSVKEKGDNGKSSKDGRSLKKEDLIERTEKKKQPKLKLNEVEELFNLLTKAQRNRVDDQRGLLKKEDLVLPDFLRLKVPMPEPSSSTPVANKVNGKKREDKSQTDTSVNKAFISAQQSDKLEFIDSSPTNPSTLNFNENPNNLKGKPMHQQDSRHWPVSVPSHLVKPDIQQLHDVPFHAPVSPILHVNDQRWEGHSGDRQSEIIQPCEDENVSDLTLVAEGDISSPNSTLLPPSLTPSSSISKLDVANYTPPTPCSDDQKNSSHHRSASGI